MYGKERLHYNLGKRMSVTPTVLPSNKTPSLSTCTATPSHMSDPCNRRLMLLHTYPQIVGCPSTYVQQDAVSVMDRSLRHAEWITEVQWYYPRLYETPGFRRLTRLVKHQRVTLWPGGLGLSRFSVRVFSYPFTYTPPSNLGSGFAAPPCSRLSSPSKHELNECPNPDL